MVRLVPEDPQFTGAAERDAWEALRRGLGPDDVLAANLRLTDEAGDHEADLVVGLDGAGVVVLEVKGGHVHHDGSRWVQTGASVKTIDPVEQARRAKYALRTYLERDPRWRRRSLRFAHALAFPYSRIPADFALPDLPRSLVLDLQDLADDPAGRLRDALLLQVGGEALPEPDDLDVFLVVLGGRGLPQRDLLAELEERQAQVELVTERQAAILSALRLLPRVEVRGGAGSGKTWLAVEQARRLALDGKRVALTCYSRGLAAYLQRRTAGLRRRERPAYVGTFHGLGLAWGAPSGSDDDSGFWEERLPAAMLDLARDLPDGQRYDAVVVDEAQDFADSWWAPLLASLRDDEAGGVFVFADEGQRVFARQGRPPVALVPVLLEENLRNTVPIAQTFGSLAPLQMRYRGGEGPPVRFVPCAAEVAVECADAEVERLVDGEGWPVDSVALLTTGRRHPVQVERQAAGQDEYWSGFYDDADVFYGHVLGFKGLERPAVVLAVNGFGVDERAREKLYVGLSRARDLLVVCGDLEQIRAVGGEGVVRRLASS